MAEAAFLFEGVLHRVICFPVAGRAGMPGTDTSYENPCPAGHCTATPAAAPVTLEQVPDSRPRDELVIVGGIPRIGEVRHCLRANRRRT